MAHVLWAVERSGTSRLDTNDFGEGASPVRARGVMRPGRPDLASDLFWNRFLDHASFGVRGSFFSLPFQ